MLCKNCGTTNVEGAVKCVKCDQVLDYGQNLNYQTPVVPMNINSWLIPAIITNVCCCLPLGVVSVYFAAKANAFVENGDFNKAKIAADKAKMWTLVGISLGIVTYLGYFIIVSVAGLGEAFKNIKM